MRFGAQDLRCRAAAERNIVRVLPVYLGLASALDEPARRRVVTDAALTAAGIGVGFSLVGDAALRALGVSVADLQVAGGLLLLGCP